MTYDDDLGKNSGLTPAQRDAHYRKVREMFEAMPPDPWADYDRAVMADKSNAVGGLPTVRPPTAPLTPEMAQQAQDFVFGTAEERTAAAKRLSAEHEARWRQEKIDRLVKAMGAAEDPTSLAGLADAIITEFDGDYYW